MKANQFLVMGNTRSYWDFYFGLGLALSISMTAEAILMWQLSSLARTEGRRLRPMMATFLVAYLAIAVNSNAHFFFAPVIFEILIAGCFGVAIATARDKTD
jgi:glycerol uptake facilitator-like aquaporin